MAHNNTISVLKDQMQEMAANMEAEFQRLLRNLINKRNNPESDSSGDSSVIGGNYIKMLNGRSSYGDLFKVRDASGNYFIVKKIDLINGTEVPLQTTREMHLLSSLKHPNIVRLERVWTEGKYIFLVMENMGDKLATHLEEKATDFLMKTKDVMRGILSGIKYCHSHGIIHRNLNPGNILINFAEKDEIKLTDFGSTIFGTEVPDPYIGIAEYSAPEILMGADNYTNSIDIWSFGCIFAEMLGNHTKGFFSGEVDGETKIDVIAKIFSVMGLPTEKSWPGVSSLPFFPHCIEKSHPKDLSDVFPQADNDGLDLLKRCLTLIPNGRISAAEALAHPFLK